MARYIDADKLIEHIKDLPTWWEDEGGVYGHSMKYPEGLFHCEDVINSIENAPTADVVEVVRCKDCKHYCLSDFRKLEEHRWCEQICDGDYYPEPTDFCSYGERKENK